MSRLFIDTNIWVAAVSPRDPGHEVAHHVLDDVVQGRWRSVHTSDYVVAETLNFVRMKIKRAEAGEAALAFIFGTDDAAPMVTNVLRIHSARFAAALERYRTRFAQGLSLTDWTSIVAMETEGIETIATLDAGFRGQVGSVVPT